ncbi:MAG: hypothetical protein PF517_10635 [Salinivirgaceae bacterium]|jgi:phosphatidylinositol glycan class B|nr:hypothetical protein [Salinivirgaceae bacterium]
MKINFEKALFIIAIVWYSITSYYSVGYYHADEHYQIIEFAELKSGNNKPDELAWEYKAKIRPAFQPTICSGLFALFEYVNITNQFTKAFLLRLLTGILAVFSISFFSSSCKSFIHKRYWKAFLIISYFLWFLPFINVRYSSETWAGLMVLLAAGILNKNKFNASNFFVVGLLLGLGFNFRFQSGIIIAGLFLWFVVVKKITIIKLWPFFIGIVVAVSLGFLSDYWFYNELVCTPWNYLKVNLVDQVANSFGTSPWYYYAYYIFRFAFFPFGSLIVLSLLYFAFRNYKSSAVWIVIPFLIIHSVLAHKELRFLFPIVNFVPVILVVAYQMVTMSTVRRITKAVLFIVVVLLTCLNTLGLFISSLKPANIGRIKLVSEIEHINIGSVKNIHALVGQNPYEPWRGLVANFYLSDSIQFTPYKTLNEFKNCNFRKDQIDMIVVSNEFVDDPIIQDALTRGGMRFVNQSIPEWMVPILHLYGGYHDEEILELYVDN